MDIIWFPDMTQKTNAHPTPKELVSLEIYFQIIQINISVVSLEQPGSLALILDTPCNATVSGAWELPAHIYDQNAWTLCVETVVTPSIGSHFKLSINPTGW